MHDHALFWDGIAESYARKPVPNVDAYARTLAHARAHLKRTDRMLELGCGTGSTALKLADGVAYVTATDVSGAMVRIAEDKAIAAGATNVGVLRADMFDPVLDGGDYDVVAAFNVFHLLRDPEAAAARAADLLRPGGVFLSKTVCEPESGAPLSFRLMRFALPVLQALGRAPYVNFMRASELERIVEAAGFDILETADYPARPRNRFIVARKR